MNTSATFVLVHGKQKGDSVDFEDLGADTPHFWGEDLSLLEEDRRRIGTASTRKNAAPRHFPRREPRDAVSEIRRKPQGDSRVPEGQVAGKQSACGSGCYTLRGHCLSASLGVIRLFGGRGESATRRLRSSGLRPEKVLTVPMVSGTFGGVIPTPAMDRIAKAGLRYTQFHSTALCSPTRAALITGRNHHSVGFGVIGEMSTGYPGYDSVIGTESATIGTILRDNGYATSWFGKNHNTPT
jgi:hypothetical protein